jgi:hypothetical protein
LLSSIGWPLSALERFIEMDPIHRIEELQNEMRNMS